MNTTEDIVKNLRRWLKSGATISATDPDGEILVQREDGTWHGGLTIQFPPGNIKGEGFVLLGGDVVTGQNP